MGVTRYRRVEDMPPPIHPPPSPVRPTEVPVNPTEIEIFEESTWVDMFAAVPAPFAVAVGLGMVATPEAALFYCQKIPFIHFNAAGSGLGLRRPLDAPTVERLVAAYAAHGVNQPWVHVVPGIDDSALRARGFALSSSWDRVARRPGGATGASPRVERVAGERARDWAAFVDKVYGLPTSPWLLALAGRPGWQHYVVARDGQVVAARSSYTRGGFTWMGIDAPVPGLMTRDFATDGEIVRTIVADNPGCVVIGDIESPSDAREGPAYDIFAELGFEVAYRRVNLRLG